MSNYKKMREDSAATTFVEAGLDLLNQNPVRFLEECRNNPMLLEIMEKNLPCKQDIEKFNLTKSPNQNGDMGKRANSRLQKPRFPTPAEVAARYKLSYDADGIILVSRSKLRNKTSQRINIHPCKWSGHMKVAIVAPDRNRKTLFFSDVVFCLHHGRWPKMMHLDGKTQNNGSAVIHIDKDKTNNHPSNLKENLGEREAYPEGNVDEFLRGKQKYFTMDGIYD